MSLIFDVLSSLYHAFHGWQMDHLFELVLAQVILMPVLIAVTLHYGIRKTWNYLWNL